MYKVTISEVKTLTEEEYIECLKKAIGFSNDLYKRGDIIRLNDGKVAIVTYVDKSFLEYGHYDDNGDFRIREFSASEIDKEIVGKVE